VEDEAVENREMLSPSVGAKLCLMVAALFAVAGGYFLLSPVQVTTATGQAFGCGSALDGPKTQFAVGICGSANEAARDRAIAAGVSAVVVGIGGLLVFAPSRRTQVAAAGGRRRTDAEG